MYVKISLQKQRRNKKMAYRCLECGHIFEDGEQARWEEHHPYGMGYAAEEFIGCPICKGKFEKTKQCKVCGGEFLEEDLNGDCVCDDCVNEYSKNFEVCYKISKEEKEEIKINALLVSLLDVADIEEILYQHLKNTEKHINCSGFAKQDKCWFAEKLAEEVKK